MAIVCGSEMAVLEYEWRKNFSHGSGMAALSSIATGISPYLCGVVAFHQA